MCGFVGILGDQLDEALLRAANDTIHHRGPDASGVYFDAEAGIGLAHKRLSIIELSAFGAQPMTSACGRFIMVFNGEIYNHQKLRQKSTALASHEWRGNSDTETLLQLIAAVGLEKALSQAIGMFALAVWDKQEKTITLARDRMGEKPLYYGWLNGSFVFASEPKALKALQNKMPDLNNDAVSLYFHHGYVPAPLSIWQNIKKLRAGKYIKFSYGSEQLWPEETAFWDINQTILHGIANPYEGNECEAMSALEDLLVDAISMQSIADVELGAFLSGGIDSSLIVALMQKHTTSPIKTFSIGFNDDAYNEAHHARKVATHLGTDHCDLFVEASDVKQLLPQMQQTFDEPFADTSMFPTYLVAKLAREHVKVCLSGDAGDELFCGYDHYFNHWSYDLWTKMRANKLLSASIKALSGLMRPLARGNGGAKLWRLNALADCKTASDYFRWSGGNTGPAVMSSMNGVSDYVQPDDFFDLLPDNESRLMAFDCAVWLADDILCKVDRSSMAVSLEARVPFLDHRIVEFAWRLPSALKTKNGTGKTILRSLLYKNIPENIVNRPKQGFSMPVEHWLKSDLREWAGDMIFGSSISSLPQLDMKVLSSRWREHQNGTYNWSETIWKSALFASWLDGCNAPAQR